MSLDLLDRHEVTDGVDHAPDLRAVLLDDHVADPLEPQRAKRLALVGLAADRRPLLLHLEPRHHDTSAAAAAVATPSARAFSRAAGATSSTRRPRRAAT